MMVQAVTRYGIPATLVIGLIALVYMLASASGTGTPKTGLPALAKGEMKKLTFLSAPPEQADETFIGPDGGPVSLVDKRGKVLVVNLWATWCPPCIEEMPTLAQLQRDYGSDGFEVMAVSVDQVGEAEYARSELARLTRGALPFYHDPTYGLAYDLSVAGFPTTIIYDDKGRELGRLAGEADWSSPDARAVIDAILAGDV